MRKNLLDLLILISNRAVPTVIEVFVLTIADCLTRILRGVFATTAMMSLFALGGCATPSSSTASSAGEQTSALQAYGINSINIVNVVDGKTERGSGVEKHHYGDMVYVYINLLETAQANDIQSLAVKWYNPAGQLVAERARILEPQKQTKNVWFWINSAQLGQGQSSVEVWQAGRMSQKLPVNVIEARKLEEPKSWMDSLFGWLKSDETTKDQPAVKPVNEVAPTPEAPVNSNESTGSGVNTLQNPSATDKTLLVTPNATPPTSSETKDTTKATQNQSQPTLVDKLAPKKSNLIPKKNTSSATPPQIKLTPEPSGVGGSQETRELRNVP